MAYSSEFFKNREKKKQETEVRTTTAGGGYSSKFFQEREQKNDAKPAATMQQTTSRTPEASDMSVRALADEITSSRAQRAAQTAPVSRSLGTATEGVGAYYDAARASSVARNEPKSVRDLTPTAPGARTLGNAVAGVGAYDDPIRRLADEMTFSQRLGAIGKAAGTGLAGGIAALGETIGVNMGAELDYLRDVGLRNYFTKPLNELDEQRRAGGYADRTIDPEGTAARLLNRSGAYTEAATDGQSAAGKFVTEGLISTAQNLPAMALGLIPTVGPALSLGTMSASAAGSRAYELQQQGVSAQEALTRGLIAGGIEAATEKIPLDEFLDLAQSAGGTSFVRGILRQMGTEAGEEAASYALNYLADKAARDPNAVFDPQELLMSAAGGAFSGGLMGGVGAAIGAVNNARANRHQAAQSDTVRSSPAQSETVQEQTGADNALRALANEIADARAQQAAAEMQQTQMQNQQMNTQNLRTNLQTEANNMQSQAENAPFMEAARRAEAANAAQVEDTVREVSPALPQDQSQNTQVQSQVRSDTERGSGLVRNERSAAFGRETEDTLDRLAKRGGASIEIVDRLTSGANAEYRNGAVRISAEALENDRAAALRDATVHELTHHIETSSEYEAFAGLVQQAVARESDVNAVLAEIVNDYAQEGIVLDEDGARRELVAKYAGEYLSSEENVRYLARENRGLFDRIREFLRDIVARFRGEDARSAREMLKTFDRALDSVGANEGNRYGETQNLIKRDADGKRFVEIEEDILEGVPKYKWEQVVKDMLANKFPNGIVIGGRRIRLNSDTRGEIARSEYSQALFSDNEGLLADKYNSSQNIDELLKTGEKWVGEEAKHDKSYEYARGKVRVRVAGRDYIADIVARSKPRGIPMVYDLVNFKLTKFTQKEMDTNYTAVSREDRSSAVSISNNGSISDGEQKSNMQTAQNRGENFGKQYSRGRTISEINARLASMTDAERATLVRENEQMQKQVAELKQQLRRTPKGRKDARAVRRSTNELLRAYDSKADAGEIGERLQALYDRQGVGEFNADRYNEDFVEAMAIARDILNESETVNDELSRQYKDMRDHIRKTAVTLSEQDRYDLSEGYNDFRRRYFGKIKLTNSGMGVDTLYGELQNDYGLLFFPDSITHPAEQLERIGEVLDSLAPTYENQYAGNLKEASMHLALQLMRQGTRIETASPTFADRAAKKLGEARAESKALRSDLRELTRQYDKDTAARDLRNERVTRALEAERERRQKNEQKLKEHFKEVNEKRRERKHDRDARNKLLKLARRLDVLKTTPQNRAKIEALIGELDLISGGLTEKNRLKLTEQLAAYEEAKSDPNFLPDRDLEAKLERLNNMQIADMDIDDVIELTQALRHLEHEIRTGNREIGIENARTFAEMADETVRDVEAAAAPKLIQDKRNWYQGLMLSPERMMRRLTGYKDGSPLQQAAQRLSDGQRKQMDFKRKSYEKFAPWLNNDQFVAEIMGRDEDSLIPASFVDVKGRMQTIQLSPGEVISMYLQSRNDHTLRHVQRGGYKIADHKLRTDGRLSKAYDNGVRVRLDPEAARNAVNRLTREQKAFADAVRDFMNNETKKAINETSLALDGYEKAMVENYFPIRTDSNFTNRDIEGIKRDGSIEGMGMLKERVSGSTNPILLENVLDVLDRQIENTSMYYGLAIPVRNMNKLLRGQGAGYSQSVREALTEKWGGESVQYLEKMLTDVQGAGLKSRDSAIFRKLRSNYAGAVLGQNISVVMKQAASYPTAAGVVGWKPLAKALNPAGIKVDKAKVAEYTPLLWNRSIGYDTQSIRDAAAGKKLPAKVLNGIQAADVMTTTRLWAAAEYYVRDHNKALDVGSDAYYQECAKIYNRIIEETQPNYSPMQRPGILRTDSEIMQALSMFKTQAYQNYNMVYDAVENARAKARQYAENPNEETKRARSDAILGLGRTISAQVVAAMTISGMTALYAAMSGRRDKLEDEEGNLDVMPYLLRTMVDTAAGSFIGGSEINTAVRAAIDRDTYYGLDVSGISTISDSTEKLLKFGQTAQDVIDAAGRDEVTDTDRKKMLKATTDMLMQLGQLTGKPVANVVKDLNMAARGVLAAGKAAGADVALIETMLADWDVPFDKAHAKYWTQKYSEAVKNGDTALASWIFEGLQENEIRTEKEIMQFDAQQEKEHVSNLVTALHDAEQSGEREDKLESLRAQLYEMKLSDGDIEDKLDEKRNNDVRQSWEYKQDVSARYLAMQDEANKSAKYAALSETKQAKLDDRLNSYTRKLADAKLLEKNPEDKWVNACMDAPKMCGLSEVDFLIVYEAQSGLGSLKKDGETITNSSSLLKMEAIYAIPGLTDKQREYMFDAAGVGKKVRGYNKALVGEKLREMRKEADK